MLDAFVCETSALIQLTSSCVTEEVVLCVKMLMSLCFQAQKKK